MSNLDELPTHADCCTLIEEGGTPTALEQFIYDNEPEGALMEEAFRSGLAAVILAGTRPGDMVLDPFGGSGTTGQVALELGRQATLIELNPEYVKLIEKRCTVTMGLALEGSKAA